MAIDGNTDGETNFTHADVGAIDPWIEIDLGGVREIDRIADLFEQTLGFG